MQHSFLHFLFKNDGERQYEVRLIYFHFDFQNYLTDNIRKADEHTLFKFLFALVISI